MQINFKFCSRNLGLLATRRSGFISFLSGKTVSETGWWFLYLSGVWLQYFFFLQKSYKEPEIKNLLPPPIFGKYQVAKVVDSRGIQFTHVQCF
jgi:hypothetical protein